MEPKNTDIFADSEMNFTDVEVIQKTIDDWKAKYKAITEEESEDRFTVSDIYELIGLFYITRDLRDSPSKHFKEYADLSKQVIEFNATIMAEYYVANNEEYQREYRENNGLTV